MSQIELTARAAIYARAIRLTLIGERPAHFFVPTTKHARKPATNGYAWSRVNLDIGKLTGRGLLKHSRKPH